MRRKTVILVCVTMCVISAVVAACDDDEDYVPSYVVELAEANSDEEGRIVSVRFDDGRTYNVDQDFTASLSDWTYRCLCTYSLDGESVHIYSLNSVFAQGARPLASYLTYPLDPLKFVSCWKSDRYLNIKVGVMTSGGKAHSYGFSADSVSTANGVNTAYFTLLHKRADNDDEAYTEETYVCMPLSDYSDFDSLVVCIPTYDGIIKVKR